MTEFKTQKDSPLPQDPQDESPEERQRFDADMKVKMEENFRDTREDLESIDEVHASRVRVTKDDEQEIAKVTAVVISYDDVDYDNLDEWDTTTFQFTGAEEGYYLARAAFTFKSAAWEAGEIAQLSLWKNGATQSVLHRHVFEANETMILFLAGSDIVYLDGELDYFDIRAYHNFGSTINSYDNALYNYLAIHRLS